MKSKFRWRFWLALVILLASLVLLAWASWPMPRESDTVPLPTVQAPQPAGYYWDDAARPVCWLEEPG